MILKNTLLADADFLASLAEMEKGEQPTAPPVSNAQPLEKVLPGFYTGKATQFAANYDNDFLQFAQKELPDAFSFWVMDIDSFVVRSRTGKIMMLELKRMGYDCKEHQARTISIIDYLVTAGMKAKKGNVRIVENGQRRKFRVEWYGYNVLKLSNDSFENSTFYWNDKPIGREMLKSVLSMDTRF